LLNDKKGKSTNFFELISVSFLTILFSNCKSLCYLELSFFHLIERNKREECKHLVSIMHVNPQ